MATLVSDDASLLAQWAASRDAGAFDELARRHAGLVYATCRRIVRDHHLAEEIAQECLFELARKADSVRTSVAGFLHATATSRARDRLRNETSRRRREALSQPLPVECAATDSEPTWAELSPMIDEALTALPDELRLPLVLHFLERRSQVEVAETLRCDQATVSRRITRGIELLRQRLGVTASVLALSALVAANAAEPAPPTLLTSASKMALAGGGPAAPAASALTVTLAIGALAVASVGGGWLALRASSQPTTQAASTAPVPASAPSIAADRERVVVWSRDWSVPMPDDPSFGTPTDAGVFASKAVEPDMVHAGYAPDQALLIWLPRVDGNSQPLFVVPRDLRLHLRLRAERPGRVDISLTSLHHRVRNENQRVPDVDIGTDWQDLDFALQDFSPGVDGARSLDRGLAIGSFAIWAFGTGRIELARVDVTGARDTR